MDGNGVNELAVELQGWTLLFKAASKDAYELFWIKKHNLSHSQVSMGDVDGDNRDEVIISGSRWNPDANHSVAWAYVFKLNRRLTAIAPQRDVQNLVSPAQLMQAFPSPFNHSTNIKYHINQPGNYQLSLYDVGGKEVNRLTDHFHSQGNYSITWNGNTETGKEVSSGIYFVVLRSGRFFQVHKTVYVK